MLGFQESSWISLPCYLVQSYCLPAIEYYIFPLWIFLVYLQKVLSSHSYCLAFSETENDPDPRESYFKLFSFVKNVFQSSGWKSVRWAQTVTALNYRFPFQLALVAVTLCDPHWKHYHQQAFMPTQWLPTYAWSCQDSRCQRHTSSTTPDGFKPML